MAKHRELNVLLHNENYPLGLGCSICPDLKECGGEFTPNLYDCMAKCCNKPEECDYVCKKDIESFLEYFHSVNGFDFGNIERVASVSVPQLPRAVALINNPSNRSEPLNVEAVAVQLRHLFNHRTGEIRFESKEHLAKHFHFSPHAKLIISGVSKDEPLEDYWYLGRARSLAKQISKLQPDLLTSPNFSVFLDSPRHDNLFNIKRILICWSEFQACGIPTALHLNARTDYDWQRWFEFIQSRPEINSISFEFATGANLAKRGRWHTNQLVQIARGLDRDIQLVIRGGRAYINELHNAYPKLVFIDTTSFIKSIKRQALVWQDERRFRWVSVASQNLKNIDELLKHNVKQNSLVIGQKFTHC